jgi:hypothetical protein
MRHGILLVAILAVAACSRNPETEENVVPEPIALPTMAFSGQSVALYPLAVLAAEETLGWNDLLRPREEKLLEADSVIATFLTERAPEMEWILPDAVRQAASRAPGMLPDPDHMGTAVLRAEGLERVPDPLISDMRNLTAVVGDRYVAVPASLVFRYVEEGMARAELTLVIVDVRRNRLAFRTVASAEGSEPWEALWNALKTLVPDLP